MALAPARRFRLRCKTALMAIAEGESSGDENECPALPSTRAMCGQFVWPCPREYPESAAQRKAQLWRIPSDLTKEELCSTFRTACAKRKLGPSIERVHVFDEPHKRYSRLTGMRERHKHLVFKMKGPFAHLQIQKDLAQLGIHGQFSFNLVGYVAYLRYCLCPSAKKLAADLDVAPWSWPSTPTASLLALCKQATPQMDGRKEVAGPGRKRKLMTFSEVTDAFVEAGIKTDQQAFKLAKSRKVAGDDALWNTLGDTRCVASLVAKVRKAWSDETMETGTLRTKPDYHLGAFVPLGSIDRHLLKWVQGGWRERSLILSGDPGLGKTELGCALAHAAATANAYHFVNKIDRIRDVVFSPGEALVVDEVCLAERLIDDMKGLTLLSKTTDVACRNRDGTIPRGTARVFSTNWSWEQFWPREAFAEPHAGAIRRRILWVNIKKDVRRRPVEPPPFPLPLQSPHKVVGDVEDEDPMGHGFGLD